jgi:phosphoribosylanthranilate isomerase
MAESRSVITTVKICGLREPDHAVAAVHAGADYVGFVFAPARRQIDAETAGRCIRDVRASGGIAVRTVGVFVNTPADEINRVASVAGLDLVQLNGDEGPEYVLQLELPAIKAIRPQPGASVDDVLRTMDAFTAVLNSRIVFLLDGYHPGAYGGAGIRTDWKLAAEVARRYPVILAGGLDPSNVGEAIAMVRPIGVDVSSGIETDGIKDPRKIGEFVTNARVGLNEDGSKTSTVARRATTI